MPFPQHGPPPRWAAQMQPPSIEWPGVVAWQHWFLPEVYMKLLDFMMGLVGFIGFYWDLIGSELVWLHVLMSCNGFCVRKFIPLTKSSSLCYFQSFGADGTSLTCPHPVQHVQLCMCTRWEPRLATQKKCRKVVNLKMLKSSRYSISWISVSIYWPLWSIAVPSLESVRCMTPWQLSSSWLLRGPLGNQHSYVFLSWLWVLVDVGEWQMLKRHWAQESWTDPLQYLSAGSKFFEDGKSWGYWVWMSDTILLKHH